MSIRRTRFVPPLILLAAVACGDDASPAPGDGMSTLPSSAAGDGAPAVGPGQFESDFRTSDDFFTQMSGLELGMSPHRWQQTWYSTTLRDLVEDDTFVAPVGTVAIKEFAAAEEGPVGGYAVMVKREAGYDPDNGDWYYEMRDPSGDPMAMPEPGPIPDCIDCHQQFATTDYLGGTRIR